MSVRGRTYPFRVVIHHNGIKPSTHVIQGDRENAENHAAEVQARGTRAEVLLVQGDRRTVVTEYPAADFDPDFDSDGRSYFVRYHMPITTEGVLLTLEHGTVTAEAGHRLFEPDARRAARAFQRAGGSAEIVRGNTVSSVYPALTGQALAGVAEPTTDERLDTREVARPKVKFERVRHAADCVSLNLTLLCDLEPRTADANGVMTGSCLTPGGRLAARPEPVPVPKAAGGYRYTLAACPGYLLAAPTANWCARCGIREDEHEQHDRASDPQRLAELETEGPLSRQLRALTVAKPPQFCPACGKPVDVTHDPDPESDGDAECTMCDWAGYASEVNDAPMPTPGVADEELDDTCTTGVDHCYELVHEDDDVSQYRCTSPGCGAENYEDKAGEPVPAPAVDLPAAGRTLADLRRVLDRGADDAETALGGELGRVTSAVLRFVADLGEPADNLTREQVRLLARLGELVTERALAHRTISRGGPDRRDVDKAALDAYSDRFEPSRKLVRDHQAAMRDAVSAVFDTVAAGTPGVLRHPSHDRHVVAIRAKDGQHDEGYPWMTSHGGYYRDRDVEGWLEMMPTGRRFDPTDARPAPAENWLTRNAVYTRTDEIPPPSPFEVTGAAFLPDDLQTSTAPTGPVDQQHEETDVTTPDPRDPKRKKPIQPARTASKPTRSHGGYGEVVSDPTDYSASEQTGGGSYGSDSGGSSSSSSSDSGSSSSSGE